jgi:hypothetical protein
MPWYGQRYHIHSGGRGKQVPDGASERGYLGQTLYAYGAVRSLRLSAGRNLLPTGETETDETIDRAEYGIYI